MLCLYERVRKVDHALGNFSLRHTGTQRKLDRILQSISEAYEGNRFKKLHLEDFPFQPLHPELVVELLAIKLPNAL